MEERRKVLRHRTLKAGHIAINRAGKHRLPRAQLVANGRLP
jgi:hypothetical protein